MDIITSAMKSIQEVAKRQVEGPNNRNFLLSVGAAAGVMATLLLTTVFARSSDNVLNSTAANDVWVLAVTLRFKTSADKAEFREMFAPLAVYVRENEPATLSYVLSESDKDPKQVLILERYTTKAAYLDVHKVSPEFKVGRGPAGAWRHVCTHKLCPISHSTSQVLHLPRVPDTQRFLHH